MPRRTTSNQDSSFYYTYVLQSVKDGNLYVGFTHDLRRRFKEHSEGKVFSTKPRRPFKLIYYEACHCSEDARRRERYFKTTIGSRFLKTRLRIHFKKEL